MNCVRCLKKISTLQLNLPAFIKSIRKTEWLQLLLRTYLRGVTAIMQSESVTPVVDIAPHTNGLSSRTVSNLSLSTSPSVPFQSLSASRDGSRWQRGNAGPIKQLKPFATEDIKILLLENVNKTGQDILSAQGYQVTCMKSSLPEDELIERIRCSSSLATLNFRGPESGY